MGLTATVVELARAARAEGVLVVKLRKGPIAELQLLPPDPPDLLPPEASEEERQEQERHRRLDEKEPF